MSITGSPAVRAGHGGGLGDGGTPDRSEDAYRYPRNGRLADAYENGKPPARRPGDHQGRRPAGDGAERCAGRLPTLRAAPSLGPGVYSDREAAAHQGETAMVVGTVFSVHRTESGNIYLNFGADYPHQTFSGAVLDPGSPALRNLDWLAGKRVGIKGADQDLQGAGRDRDPEHGADCDGAVSCPSPRVRLGTSLDSNEGSSAEAALGDSSAEAALKDSLRSRLRSGP